MVGQLQGNLDLQKGKQDELLQNYRKAVLSGFADVEKCARRHPPDGVAREAASATWVTSSQRAFDISEQRLREGTVDLVTVLQTQQTLYQAQDVLAQARLRARAGDREPLSGRSVAAGCEAGGSLQCTVNCRSRSGPRPAAAVATS